MSDESFDVVFAVIAPREVTFFSNVADVLAADFGLRSAFVTLYGPAARTLAGRGYRVFDPHAEIHASADAGGEGEKEGEKEQEKEGEISRLERKYGLASLRQMILHEKLTFNRFDESLLADKVIQYDRYFDSLLRNNRIGAVVQELGGFIAPLTLYHNCLARGVRHVFLEPSMYTGRLCYDVDSLNSTLAEPNGHDEAVSQAVRNYLGTYENDKPVVIPSKDRHHFASGLGKLLNRRNCRRLAEKLYVKYVRREREEYDRIANHVKRHAGMYMRRWLMWRLYRKPDYSRTYAYFPLHVPLDFQLTVRENRYLDQIALVQTIANSLPFGWQLYIKEHPAAVGAYEFGRLRRLHRTGNVRLIEPTVNSFDLIRESACVITINSKVGAEALMQGKRVLVLGRPTYLQSRHAVHVAKVEDLSECLRQWQADSEQVDYDFFCRAYAGSYRGELYDNSPQNVKDVSLALKKHLPAGGRE